MVNFDYPMRQVKIPELVTLFGSATAAMEKTGADEALALYFIHNPDGIANARRVSPTLSYLRGPLEVLVMQEKIAERDRLYTERVKAAAVAYNAKPTLSAIREACKCGHPVAVRMLQDAKDSGWVKA